MKAERRALPRMLATPFHSRVARACETNAWHDWQGYTTPESYTDVELEYFAIRNSAGVFDLSPMFKYRIAGPDAEAYMNRLATRDVGRLAPGRVGYGVWCDERGQVVDDGTIFRLGERDFRLCAYTRTLDWLCWSALGFDVSIVDETAELAALAVQGPTSCAALRAMGLDGLERLRPFELRHFAWEGAPLLASRTGFTGDLGYELWIRPDMAETLWDRLFAAGEPYLLRAVGGAAIELARIEAGFLQAGVDFAPAGETVRAGRTRSPFELGLGWLVDLDKPVFNGRGALLAERRRGARRRMAILDVEGNKPAEHAFVYRGARRVGTVCSAAWCPTSKSNVALADIDAACARPGTELEAEIYYQRELRWTRLMARCVVLEKTLFNPERRRLTPAPSR